MCGIYFLSLENMYIYILIYYCTVVLLACTVVRREPFDFSIPHIVRNLFRIFRGLNVRHWKTFRKRSGLNVRLSGNFSNNPANVPHGYSTRMAHSANSIEYRALEAK